MGIDATLEGSASTINREPGRSRRLAWSSAMRSPWSSSGCSVYQCTNASSTRSAPRGPAAGAMGASLALPRSAAMRSPSRTASQAASAPARAACTDLKRVRVPKYSVAAVSATSRVRRSRSAWNNFVWGFPLRAVSRQSIWRASSPMAYSRDSAYSMPRPRKLDNAWPCTPRRPRRAARCPCTRLRSPISSARVGVMPLLTCRRPPTCRPDQGSGTSRSSSATRRSPSQPSAVAS